MQAGDKEDNEHGRDLWWVHDPCWSEVKKKGGHTIKKEKGRHTKQ